MSFKTQTGFIKWAVAAAILALAALAGYFFTLPKSRDAIVQMQIEEIFVSVDSCRAEIARVVQSTQAPILSTSLFACDGGASAGTKISKHLKSIAVSASGAINVTLDIYSLPELTPTTRNLTVVPLTGNATVLVATDVGRTISGWRCGSPQDGTTVLANYLPVGCRG